uniref:Cytochrome P450 n=2 Tax=Chenopodium quinoa TaxID=63459 RepID=A0A803N9V6_CHEQI
MFLNHDLAFSSGNSPDVARAENHVKFSMVFLPGLPVDIGMAGFTTSLNLLSNTFFSMDLASHSSSKSQEIKDLVWLLLDLCAKPNVSDFFPLIKHLDLQGVLKTNRVYFKKLMRIFEEIIDERLKDPKNVKDDVLGTLLKLVESNELSLDEVKHLLVTVLDALRAGNHFKFSMVFLPVCPKWRILRKVATIQLFTNQRLDMSQDIRHKKVKELVEYVQQCCDNGLSVDIGKTGFITSLNLLSNTFFSMDLASHTSSKSQQFKDLVWLLLEALMKIFEEIIDERLKDPMDVKDDVLGTLLKLVENNELSLDDVKHLLLFSRKSYELGLLYEDGYVL